MNVTPGLAAASSSSAPRSASQALPGRPTFQRHLHPERTRSEFHLGRHVVRARLRPHLGQLRLVRRRPSVGDFWRFVVDLPDGTKCNNDGVKPGTVTFKVDARPAGGHPFTTNPATGVHVHSHPAGHIRSFSR